MSEHMIVTVCTRERPKMLMACLRSVLPQLEAAEVQTSLVVVENDIEPKNEEAVLGLGEQFPAVRIEYRLEPELGIPFARNTAVETALELGADWIFFIDDDEEVKLGWFNSYLAAIREHNGDIYSGPVDYIYPRDHPQHLRRQPYRGGATGSTVAKGVAGNMACRSIIFSKAEYGLTFSNQFRFTGGEDIDFFRNARDRGLKIIWLDEARVVEPQPANRLRPEWLLHRQRSNAAFRAHTVIESMTTASAVRFFLVRIVRHTIQIGLRSMALITLYPFPKYRKPLTLSIQKTMYTILGYIDAVRRRLPQPYA